MKIISLRTAALGAVAAITLLISTGTASALDLGIQVGGPPPPPRIEHRWARPYPNAVWIGGHNEWRGGRWVWVGGYYGYPPYPGAIWIDGHYRHGYWRPGHWSRA